MAFFGHAKRLQRDVLGEAAARCLDGIALPPIVALERLPPSAFLLIGIVLLAARSGS
jgi:hypothetical protein